MDTIQKKKTVKHAGIKGNTGATNTIMNRKIQPDDLMSIPLELIEPGKNYRMDIDREGLESFAEEIAQHGILSALLLRPVVNNRYEIVAGERRYRAAKLAGLREVPATVRQLTDEEVIELQLAENLQRENPHPLHEALAITRMLDSGKPIEEISKRLGKNKAFIYNRIKLSALNKPIQDMFLAGKFSLAEAISIAGLSTESQTEFYEKHCKGWKDKSFRIPNLTYVLSSYRLDLTKATFDTKDKTLDAKAGVCTECPFNSATLRSLFPEQATTSVCSNKTCYQGKASVALERAVTALLKEGLPDLMFVPSSLSRAEETVLGKFPDLSNLKTKSIYEVDRCEFPVAPSKVSFQHPDDAGERRFDTKAYASAVQEYETELDEFNTLLANRSIRKGLYLHSMRASLVYYRNAKSTQPGGGVTAKEVQEAVKAGTVTTDMLKAEIQRLQQKEKRSKELDVQKIQLEIHARFTESLTSFDDKATLTPDDQVAARLLVFQSMGFQAMQQAIQTLFPEKKDLFRLEPSKRLAAIAGLTDAQFAYMIRLAMCGRSESKLPDNITSVCLYRVAGSAGLDLPSIEKAQAEVAETREKRVKERVAEIRKQIRKL